MLKVRNFVPKSVLMLSATYSEFRKDLKQFLDQVITNVDTLIIHRGKGKAVVVMSLEEYNALCATSHELSSIKNKAHLDASIQQIGKDMIDFIPVWISALPQEHGMTTNIGWAKTKRKDQKHRLIYQVLEKQVIVVKCRYHYAD